MIEIEKKFVDQIDVARAEKVLIDNGIEADEAAIVLQAIGYTLLNTELYPPLEPVKFDEDVKERKQ